MFRPSQKVEFRSDERLGPAGLPVAVLQRDFDGMAVSATRAESLEKMDSWMMICVMGQVALRCGDKDTARARLLTGRPRVLREQPPRNREVQIRVRVAVGVVGTKARRS